jgi:hypothetical protein
MKSHAVFSDGAGIPGVSGDENVHRPARPLAILGSKEKLPGEVPKPLEEGFPPSGGRV